VRLTADNPLIFPEIIIEAKKKLEAGADLVSTREIDMTTRKIRHYFPKGQSVDAFDSSLLIPGDDMVEYEKEHVLPYLLRKAKNFKIQTPDFGKFIGNIDLLDNYSVDTLDDYKNAKLLVED
jgi:spore coat polysaccharide biosynthesis protein SpsF (cytidylyltransferase family)